MTHICPPTGQVGFRHMHLSGDCSPYVYPSPTGDTGAPLMHRGKTPQRWHPVASQTADGVFLFNMISLGQTPSQKDLGDLL